MAARSQRGPLVALFCITALSLPSCARRPWLPCVGVTLTAREQRRTSTSAASPEGREAAITTARLWLAWRNAAAAPPAAWTHMSPRAPDDPPPPCPSALLCAWERGARTRALRALERGDR